MSKKNLLSGRDKELQEMAEQYEAAKAAVSYTHLDVYKRQLLGQFPVQRKHGITCTVELIIYQGPHFVYFLFQQDEFRFEMCIRDRLMPVKAPFKPATSFRR